MKRIPAGSMVDTLARVSTTQHPKMVRLFLEFQIPPNTKCQISDDTNSIKVLSMS